MEPKNLVKENLRLKEELQKLEDKNKKLGALILVEKQFY